MKTQYRGRAWRRKQRHRIISKRINIIKYVWNTLKNEWLLGNPGKYSKYNLSCNCYLCKGEKHKQAPTMQQRKENNRFHSFHVE